MAALFAVVTPAAAQARHHRPVPPTTADTTQAAQPAPQPSEQPAGPADTGGMAQAAAPTDEGSAQGSAAVGVEANAEGVAPVVEDEVAQAPTGRAVRLGFTGGLGRVSEAESEHAANFAEAALRAAYIGVEDLEIALDGSLQFYERTYVTTLPGNSGAGALRVPVDETRLRTGLSVGYNLLGPAGVDREFAEVAPYLRFELDQFRNDVVPQSIFDIGLGLDTSLRIADGLHLEAGVAYGYAVSAGPAEVAARLAFGTVLGELRYRGGIVISVPPRARLRVGYEGEWVALEHSNSYQNSLSLGLDVDF